VSVVYELDNEDCDRIAKELEDPETFEKFSVWIQEGESDDE
jgi:hypothetical protein